MKNEKIIKKFEELMINGKGDDAKEYLLSEAFINHDDSILKELFYRNFPASNELQRELNQSLKNLFDDQNSERIKAAKYISSKARGVINLVDAKWLKDPRTTQLLRQALNDKDEKVVFEMIIALWNISESYEFLENSTIKAFKELCEYSGSKRVSDYLVGAIGHMEFDGKWNYILTKISNRPNKEVKTMACHAIIHYGKNMDSSLIGKFRIAIKDLIKNEKDVDVKRKLLSTFGTIGEIEDVNFLESCKGKDIHHNNAIDFSIKKIKEKK